MKKPMNKREVATEFFLSCMRADTSYAYLRDNKPDKLYCSNKTRLHLTEMDFVSQAVTLNKFGHLKARVTDYNALTKCIPSKCMGGILPAGISYMPLRKGVTYFLSNLVQQSVRR